MVFYLLIYLLMSRRLIMRSPGPHTGFPMRANLSRLRLFQQHQRILVWAGKSSSPAGLSTLVHAYLVDLDCTPVSSPFASSTHRFPNDRTPIEATPLSGTSADLGLGLGLGLGLDSLAYFSSHTLPFFSPPSFHTLSLFPTFTSVWWSD
jgi:hypothetical protein